MLDDLYCEDLERTLAMAPILDVAAWAAHGAHRSFRLILEGGIGVLAKPEDGIQDGPVLVRREVAGWLIAREFGWHDMLAATVLRTIDSPDTGAPVAASLQVLWPDVLPDADPSYFSDEDIWRAAVFDAAIGHTDRSGHNWLCVPQPTTGNPSMLKLIDHGYGFPTTAGPPSSTFYAARAGQQIPAECLAALARCQQPRHGAALRDLLDSSSLAAIDARINNLLSSHHLSL